MAEWMMLIHFHRSVLGKEICVWESQVPWMFLDANVEGQTFAPYVSFVLFYRVLLLAGTVKIITDFAKYHDERNSRLPPPPKKKKIITEV